MRRALVRALDARDVDIVTALDEGDDPAQG